MSDFSKRLKKLRHEKKLAMDMLVDDINSRYPELNFNKSMLSRWENGLAEPSLNSAKYLSLFFDVSIDYLVGLTDDRTPPKRALTVEDKVRGILVDLRTKRNLTQTELGKVVGKSKTAVASWEQGLSMPDVATLYQLAQYYGKSMNFMCGESGSDDD